MARIDVLTDRPIGMVDRKLFGGLTEGSHLPGGTGAPAAVRGLGVSSVRWPGHRSGTDEFMAWCAAAGAEPVLSLDVDAGTLDDALAWVEYCNGSGGTYWAGRRRANGHADPYRVRYWSLGQHTDLAERYVTQARRWAKALRRLDPGISLISCGQTGLDDWDRVVIDGLARHVDFHGVRLYTGSADYWSNVLAPHYAERALSVAGALIDRARYVQRIDREISVAYDGWHVRPRAGRYDLADALAVATYLNVFVRQSWTVRMASLARLVNVTAPVAQSICHPFQLMAAASQQVALDTITDSGTHAHTDAPGEEYRVADLGLFELLDVAATRDPARSMLSVSVVNRAPDQAIGTRIRLHDARAAGLMTVHEVTADSTDAAEVSVHGSKREVEGEHLDLTFGPHSFTVVELPLA